MTRETKTSVVTVPSTLAGAAESPLARPAKPGAAPSLPSRPGGLQAHARMLPLLPPAATATAEEMGMGNKEERIQCIVILMLAQ